jgi:hypothetical protein
MPQRSYQLSQLVSQASARADQLAVYTQQRTAMRGACSLNSALLAFFQQQFASPTLATSIYTPTTGFSDWRAVARVAAAVDACFQPMRARWLLEPMTLPLNTIDA